MTGRKQNLYSWLFVYASRAAAAITLCVGASVLIGWMFDVASLKTVFPGLVTMKVNTALGFVVAGISLWAASTGGSGYLYAVISKASGCCVALLGILTILEYLTGEDFGIDQFFIQEITDLPGDIPGRMAVNTAVSFAMTGSALVLIDLRKKGVVPAIHFFAAAVMLIAGTALVGYVFSIEAFVRVKLHYTPMAVHTALAFVLIGLGIISFRPDFPFYRMMTSAAPADRMVRGLLPAVIGLPFVTGWVISKLYHAGYFSYEVGFALFAAATVVGLCAVVQWNAGSLYKADAWRKELEEEVRKHHEVEERKKVEDEIRRMAESLKDAQRMAHIGNWELDLITNVLRWSDEIYRIFEIDPAQFGASYEAFLDAIHPDDRAAVNEAYTSSIENGTPYVIEHRLLLPGGRVKYVHERCETFYDEDGRAVRSIGTVQDITERKQAEEEIERLKYFYQGIVENIVTGVWVSDKDDVIYYANKGMGVIAGIPASRIVGAHVLKSFPEGTLKFLGPLYLKARETLAPVSYDSISVVTPTGRESYQSGWLIPKILNGRFEGIICTVEDVTENKKAQQALQLERDKLISVLSAMEDGVYIVNQDGDIEYVNPVLEREFGPYEGRKCYEYFHDRQEACPWCPNPRVFAGETVHWEWYSEKNKRTYDLIDTPLINPDGSLSKLEIFRDVTDRKHAEEARKKMNEELMLYASQLETANSELSAFVYTASHVLRSPLRGINGYSHILLDEFAGSLNDEGRRLLTAVSRNAIEMNQYIDDLLAYSNAGRKEIRPVLMDIEDTAQSVIAELESVAANRRIRFEVKVLPHAHGDKRMMRQVFFNLLSNAMKFTRPTDEAVIEVGGWAEKDEGIYYVKDNGVGFDARYQSKLFDVFQRLHGAEEFEGTGIGLAIVKRIIEKHGGRVWAEGKVNEGATFYFTLPRRQVGSGT